MSQSVPDAFHDAAFSNIVEPLAKVMLDFTKTGGTEIFPDWSEYTYTDYTNRLVSLEWSRSIEFPDTTQYAVADLTFNNFDQYFTPLNNASPISGHNYPERPLYIQASYGGQTANYLTQLIGATSGMPRINNSARTASYHVRDYLSIIAEEELTSVVAMRNVRTDEVLAAIFDSLGIDQSQYSLERGTNTIPFVFFDRGEKAGDAIRKLVQAEYGALWLDETGVIRFRNRIHTAPQPTVALTNHDIISIEPKGDDKIINHVKIAADVREVQEYQTVYEKTSTLGSTGTDLWVVPAGGTLVKECPLEDPCYEIVAPILGENSTVSWFTAYTATQVQVDYGITATGVLSSNAYTITFTNITAGDVEIDELRLWGEPAKVYDRLVYEAYDDVSLANYGDHLLEITNNEFFQNYDTANSFGRYCITDRRDYNDVLIAAVKGDFALQIGDVVNITEGEYTGNYQIEGMTYSLSAGSLTTKLTLRKSVAVDYFILDQSVLNGTDVLG